MTKEVSLQALTVTTSQKVKKKFAQKTHNSCQMQNSTNNPFILTMQLFITKKSVIITLSRVLGSFLLFQDTRHLYHIMFETVN